MIEPSGRFGGAITNQQGIDMHVRLKLPVAGTRKYPGVNFHFVFLGSFFEPLFLCFLVNLGLLLFIAIFVIIQE